MCRKGFNMDLLLSMSLPSKNKSWIQKIYLKVFARNIVGTLTVETRTMRVELM